MKQSRIRLWTGMLLALAATPQSLLACATCFGASDSDLARGLNWGILSLLLMVLIVLSGIASFFIYLVRRAAAIEAAVQAADVSRAEAPEEPAETFK